MVFNIRKVQKMCIFARAAVRFATSGPRAISLAVQPRQLTRRHRAALPRAFVLVPRCNFRNIRPHRWLVRMETKMSEFDIETLIAQAGTSWGDAAGIAVF
jgi:hypothetical protein